MSTDVTEIEQTDPGQRAARYRAELALLERVKAVGGAAVAVLGICAVLGGYALFVLNQAEAQQKPIEVRVSYVETQQIFALKEQRETREDIRAIGKSVESLGGSRIAAINRPMAPLPIPDAGP